MEWQPIETAPKDGTTLLTCVKGYRPALGWYCEDHDRWFASEPEDHMTEESWDLVVSEVQYKPTHWMPLPETPQ